MAILNNKKRIEKDSLGEKSIPLNAYYGIYTERVLENFGVPYQNVPQVFLRTYIRVKKCYAKVNSEVEKLPKNLSVAIIKSADKILDLNSESFEKLFPIGIIQSGGGTSTNMMVNEVIANTANELFGGKRGIYSPIHPNDHVNMSQSSNDTFPGVSKITTAIQLVEFIKSLTYLKELLYKKSLQYKKYIKVGRTHLQDAVKMTVGDEFSAFSQTISKNIKNLNNALKISQELPFGATALGSMQNISPQIRKQIIKELSKEFDMSFFKPENYYEGTSSSGDLAKISSDISNAALDLVKIASDLRILSSGPRAGINEIALPVVQAGSSIMPGKVNPSIPEAFMMICFKVVGNNHAIEMSTTYSQLQLQVFMPIIAFIMYENLFLLNLGCVIFSKKCIEGITINHEEIKHHFERSFIYATDYSEVLGYAKVAELVKIAYKEKLNLIDLINKELKKKNRR